MAIVKMKPSSIIVFVLYNYHNIYNLMENHFIAVLIVNGLKNSNISFELVIDNSFPPEYVREVYPLVGEDQKKGYDVFLRRVGESCPK